MPGDCTCGAIQGQYSFIHLPLCPAAIAYPCRKVDPDADKVFDFRPAPSLPGLIINAPAVKSHKERKPRRRPRMPDYRFVLQFYFTRPINLKMWDAIKAPLGWRKNPVNKQKQHMYMGVRFRCDDLKYALTPDDIALLHSKLLLSLEI